MLQVISLIGTLLESVTILQARIARRMEACLSRQNDDKNT